LVANNTGNLETDAAGSALTGSGGTNRGTGAATLTVAGTISSGTGKVKLVNSGETLSSGVPGDVVLNGSITSGGGTVVISAAGGSVSYLSGSITTAGANGATGTAGGNVSITAGGALAAGAIDAYLDRVYAKTRLGDRDFRLPLFERQTVDIVATKDPFVDLALMLDPLYQQNRDADKRRQGAESRLRPRYMEALLAKEGGLVAPDANGTLRVTFGQVKGVDGRDGIFWKPFTTLAGIEQKNTGERDFHAPTREMDAIQALRAGTKTPFVDAAIGDVPVDFLSTVDTTGGNSGSPTLDGHGRLVGLLFDGTYDTIASDFLYDPIRTRSIHVDVRYMLWTMAEVDGATRLLKEMGIQ